MQQLQPEQAHFLLHTVFLPQIRNEQRLTQSVIEAIPADKGDYRPDNFAKSALELASHIAGSEIMFMESVARGQFDFSGGPKDGTKTSADVARWYNEKFEAAFDKLTKLPDEQMSKIMDFHGMFQLPAVMYLGFALNHSIHHRGQLSTYLRPMGGKVPAIYGESYDSAQARKASQQTA